MLVMGPDKKQYKLVNSIIMKNIEKSCVNVTLLDRLLMLHARILNCVALKIRH